MNLTQIGKITQKFMGDNAPALLTGVGVVGLVSTAYLTGKASFKAAKLLSDENHGYFDRSDSIRERSKLVWHLYIPAASTGVFTVACIIGANRVGSRRAAAMAAAWSASDRIYSEYKEKVLEHIGENEARKIREKVTEQRVANTPPDDQWEYDKMIQTSDDMPYVEGSVLCYEEYTGRYFMSDMETLKKGQNDTNYQILHENYASLSDFYGRVGLPSTKVSSDVGWNSDHQVELTFTSVLTTGGAPCLAVDYAVMPISRYYNTH